MFFKYFLPILYIFSIQTIFCIENTEFEEIRQSFLVVDLNSTREFFNRYNSAAYPEFLANSFDHINVFLNFGLQIPNPKLFIDKVFNLFDQRLHATSWINGFMFENSLKNLLKLETLVKRTKSIQDQILDLFNSQQFKSLDKVEITDKINNIFNNSDLDDKCFIFSLEKLIRTYLEKILWSPEDNVWQSIKNIGYQLELLYKAGLIYDEASLNSLFWILINRFAYFLELAGQDINNQRYGIMHRDLALESLLLWELPENESYITSKKAYLQRIIVESNAVSVLYTREFISSIQRQ